MRRFLCLTTLVVVVYAVLVVSAAAEVVTRLPGPAVALTFDACETRTPSFFDTRILDYLVENRLPFTVFVSGNFAVRNRAALAELARHPYVTIGNHSMHHVQHLERLSPEALRREVREAEAVITEITGRLPRFFRFPAGNYDAAALALVEGLGYRVVHWTFPSGDPDKTISARRLADTVLARTRTGDILIFHVNGRGYGTAEALPEIVAGLTAKGMSFVTLDAGLP